MIKVGIAGYGKIGQLRANAITKIDNAKVIAIYDIDTTQIDGNKVRVCRSYD